MIGLDSVRKMRMPTEEWLALSKELCLNCPCVSHCEAIEKDCNAFTLIMEERRGKTK